MIYLDTSVLVALLANEERAPLIRDWYASNDTGLFATSDWSVTEFSSALGLKVRTSQLTPTQSDAVHGMFESFVQGGVRRLAVSRHAFQHGASLIRSMHGLRAGDALHLAVALEAQALQFATLDKLLAAKASQAGLQAITFQDKED